MSTGQGTEARGSPSHNGDKPRHSPAPSCESDEETREGVGKMMKIPITVTKPFNFSMDQRLKERQHYDEDLKKRQRAAEERERIIKQQKEREEAEELKKYRKTLDFKANPIHTYRGISLNPSEKELTVPQGPRLTSIHRSRDEPRETMRADSRASSDYGDPHPYSYNGPTLL